MKRALITGINGQSGSYLAEFLLAKGYEVHGIIRKCSTTNTWRIDHIKDQIFLHYGDMLDSASLRHAISGIVPDEIYNLAAQGHVKVSFETPEYTTKVIALGTLNLLQAVFETHREARVFQAGSSEMFGSSPPPQNELTPFHPRSPYGIAKVAAHHFAVNYREAYGMFVCNGIMFNHESPRRDEMYVTRKITKAVARIKAGKQRHLFLGNLDAKRDWGFAGDYVKAMCLMLQQDKPDDYVVATGQSQSVMDLVKLAFARADLHWQEHVQIDPGLYRPTEVDRLHGDASKCRAILQWNPNITFENLIRMMVDSDLASEMK